VPAEARLRWRRWVSWLVLVPALALLLFWKEETGGRPQPAAQGRRLVPLRIDARLVKAVGPGRGDRQGEGTQVSQAPPFAEIDVLDHLDGRRDDPLYSKFWHEQQRRIIERQYGYAINSLNLPEETSSKLTDLLTARREAAVDARDAAQQLGIVGPQANVAVKQSVDALTDEIKQLVGSDAYNSRIELAPTLSACADLLDGAVGSNLDAQGAALTADQLYSLAEDYVSTVYSRPHPRDRRVWTLRPGLRPSTRRFWTRQRTSSQQCRRRPFASSLSDKRGGSRRLAPGHLPAKSTRACLQNLMEPESSGSIPLSA
jgi:hypothetical protein